MGLIFLDTNILLYAASGRYTSPRKFRKAQEIVGDWSFCTSAQVLQEFYVNVVRKKNDSIPMPVAQARELVARLSENHIVPTDAALINAAIAHSIRYKISYWDAAILAAAERMSCETVYSEDLNPGQEYGAVTVMNPFAEAA